VAGGAVVTAFFLLGPAAQSPSTSTTLSGTSPKYQTTERVTEHKIRRTQQIMINAKPFLDGGSPGPPKGLMNGGIILGIMLGIILGIPYDIGNMFIGASCIDITW
jgi:hypothetical protein